MTALTKHQERGGQVAAPVAGEDAWLSMIERAARDPSVDVSKMERMFEMRERVMKTSAEQAFNASFVAVRAAVGPVIKNKNNDQTRSKYADLFAIADVLDPIMTENGFAATFGTADCPLENHYRITGTLLHAQGHSKEYHVDVPVDGAGIKGQTNKTATHAFGSTMTYGRRYLKVAMFDISITDSDGNRHRQSAPAPHPPQGRGNWRAPEEPGQVETPREPPPSSLKHSFTGDTESDGLPKGKSAHAARKNGDWQRVSERLDEELKDCATKGEATMWWEKVRTTDEEYQAWPQDWRKTYRDEHYLPVLAGLDDEAELVEWEEAGARG
jgi:hypothetical protein